MIDRRTALQLMLAAGVTGCRRPASKHAKVANVHDDNNGKSVTAQKMPALFLAHGSPVLLDDGAWVRELGAWAGALPRPKAVLMLSAHWVDRPVTLGASARTVPLVYDFYGFPAKYYQQTYPAPPAPALAARVKQLLHSEPVADDPERGLDHGAYVPLVAMYPEANVPVLQASLPSMEPTALFSMGRALAPLRDEGVLIVGSGFLTHNLRTVSFNPSTPTPAWAAEFDAWAADVIARRDVDALLDYRQRAPGVQQALPTHEHFVPVIVSMGAAIDDPNATARFPITGFAYGTATKRSVQLG